MRVIIAGESVQGSLYIDEGSLKDLLTRLDEESLAAVIGGILLSSLVKSDIPLNCIQVELDCEEDEDDCPVSNGHVKTKGEATYEIVIAKGEIGVRCRFKVERGDRVTVVDDTGAMRVETIRDVFKVYRNPNGRAYICTVENPKKAPVQKPGSPPPRSRPFTQRTK
jgi:hypothetical protein